MSALLLWALSSAPALALEPNERLRLELAAGGELEGYFFDSDGERVAITAGGDVVWVSLSLVEQAWRDGAHLELAQLRAEAEHHHEEALARATDPGLRRPPPLAVGAASMLWPGAGHAMLGDWGAAAGYSAVELALVGAATYWLVYRGQAGPLIPIVGLDLVFRSYAVVESTRAAKRRRALVFSPTTGDDGGLWVGVIVGTPPPSAMLP